MGHHHDLKGVMLAFLLLALVSCLAKYYINIFGDYTYSDTNGTAVTNGSRYHFSTAGGL